MKDLLTTPFFPSFPRVARVSKRQTSDLLIQRRGAWRSFVFFYDEPLLSREPHRHENSLLPQKIILFPRVTAEETKRPKRQKKIKSSLLSR